MNNPFRSDRNQHHWVKLHKSHGRFSFYRCANCGDETKPRYWLQVFHGQVPPPPEFGCTTLPRAMSAPTDNLPVVRLV
jgi:hypothetical protein